MTGFTIGGGFSNDTGGNVLVSSPSSLTLTGVRIRGGQADFGGGIAVRGTLVATNSLIDGNFATDGGGPLRGSVGRGLADERDRSPTTRRPSAEGSSRREPGWSS